MLVSTGMAFGVGICVASLAPSLELFIVRSEEAKEGMNAFLAGRAPNFQKFRMRAKKELTEYVDGFNRDLNAPPDMRRKKAKT